MTLTPLPVSEATNESSAVDPRLPLAWLFVERGKAATGAEDSVWKTQTYTNTTTPDDGTEEKDTDWEEGT